MLQKEIHLNSNQCMLKGVPKDWALYATLFLSALIIVAILKLWFYLVWLRNSLMREMKRMELRVLMELRRPTA